MDDHLLHSVFDLHSDGRLFWKNPPPNHRDKVGCEAGYLNQGKGKNKSYWQIRIFGLTLKRSRVVYRMAYGKWPEPAVDHINGDSLDDRPENLREATQSQNTASARRPARASGLPQGVHRTRQGRFMARLTIQGRTASLGTFATADEASKAYRVARAEAYREFA